MASATQHPNHSLISSEEGTEVYDVSGKHIGEIIGDSTAARPGSLARSPDQDQRAVSR